MIEDAALVVLSASLAVMALVLRSALAATTDLTAQLVASVRSDAQRTVDDQSLTTEVATLRATLAQETARADALTEYISHDAHQTDPNADLAPDDVAGRVLRLSQRWSAAAGSALPDHGARADAVAHAAVRDPAAAAAPAAHVPGK